MNKRLFGCRTCPRKVYSFSMRQKFYCVILIVCFFSGVPCVSDPSFLVIENPWPALRALLMAYPEKISGIDYDFAMKDWFLMSGDEKLFWADGRLLPEKDLKNKDTWRSYIDYLYPSEIPNPTHFSPETIAKLNAEILAENRKNSTVYNISFYDLLYDGETRRKIESHIKRFDYLGARVSVHVSIIEPLLRVEKRLNEMAKTKAEVKMFIDSISTIEGYNWREIADSPSRSNHSWGIAVDILPKNWGKKNIYWNWISYWNEKWMLIPLDRRWMPPLEVISVFEDEGFIWGGKWLLWDNMHFEYRPELLVLQKWGYEGAVLK